MIETACCEGLRIGTPGKLPVVLLHGLFGSSGNWRAVARELGDVADVRLLDLPNHGAASDLKVADYQTMAADVATWLARADLGGPPVLIGHSMGGKVAMTLALNTPDKVRALAVLDIAPSESPDLESSSRLIEIMSTLSLESVTSRSEADTVMTDRIDDPRLRQFLLQNLERTETGRYQWRLNLPALRAALPALKSFPSFDDGQTFDGPTLFIKGADSDYISDADRDLIQRLFPRSRMVTIKGAGHWLNADASEATARTLRDFLERHA